MVKFWLRGSGTSRRGKTVTLGKVRFIGVYLANPTSYGVARRRKREEANTATHRRCCSIDYESDRLAEENSAQMAEGRRGTVKDKDKQW